MTTTPPPAAPPGPPAAAPVLRSPAGPATPEDVAALAEARDRIVSELSKRIIGQHGVIDLLMTSLFANGHGLFIGVPGLAKTLLISSLARAVDLDFSRIQFTPDLMPSDITGTDVLEEEHATKRRFFKFIKGPIFCNLLLADEINRTPPKTQAALLQAMQERHVTAAGTTHALEPPFLVFATQNPIEQEGTYPLPEAQLDRFMLSIRVDYPAFDEEVAIVQATTGEPPPPLEPVLSREELVRFQHTVLGIVAAEDVVRHAVTLARRTRPDSADAPEVVQQYVGWGAGPRASQYLVLGAKARAALRGRFHVSIDDVRALAPAVLGHRVLPNFRAEAERIDSTALVEELLQVTPARG